MPPLPFPPTCRSHLAHAPPSPSRLPVAPTQLMPHLLSTFPPFSSPGKRSRPSTHTPSRQAPLRPSPDAWHELPCLGAD
eukprot:300100-Chlamydomonas_euryale.AAC.2